MDANFIHNLLEHAWPPLVLLAVIWTVLLVSFFFVRRQLKKEKELLEGNNRSVNSFRRSVKTANVTSNINFDGEDFLKEIDQLAIYVSRLPRPDNVIREYRRDEFENGNNRESS